MQINGFFPSPTLSPAPVRGPIHPSCSTEWVYCHEGRGRPPRERDQSGLRLRRQVRSEPRLPTPVSFTPSLSLAAGSRGRGTPRGGRSGPSGSEWKCPLAGAHGEEGRDRRVTYPDDLEGGVEGGVLRHVPGPCVAGRVLGLMPRINPKNPRVEG